MNDYSFIYSESIFAFLQRVKTLAVEIVQKHLRLKVQGRKPPYFLYQGKLWPLHFVVFQDTTKLGFFNKDSFEIGLHKQYLFAEDQALKELLEHEIAHYMLFIECGELGHGKAFKDFCKQYGFKASLAHAKSDEDPLFKLPDLARKVEKLLSLAKSQNLFEAQSATQKANLLIIKHNLNKQALNLEQEPFFLRRILEQKRADSLMHCIQTILSPLPLQVVLNRCQQKVFLEVFGSQENVLVAEYMAHFLQRELPRLWQVEKKQQKLKGLCSKNSFFMGFAEAFNKQRERIEESSETSLILLEKQLQTYAKRVYPRLKEELVKRKCCPKAQAGGRAAAKKIKIPSALNGGQRNLPFLKYIC